MFILIADLGFFLIREVAIFIREFALSLTEKTRLPDYHGV